jgi:hypothetical protein
MRYSTLGSIAFISAVAVALMIAFLAHTVLGMPRSAIRIDALGMAACLTVFIGAGLFMQPTTSWGPQPTRQLTKRNISGWLSKATTIVPCVVGQFDCGRPERWKMAIIRRMFGMTEPPLNEPLGPPEFINGRRIQGYPWGWVVDKELVKMAKFPGQPLTVRMKFDTLELAKEAAVSLGPIQEIDESEYRPTQTP